jgi:hypothetical protein
MKHTIYFLLAMTLVGCKSDNPASTQQQSPPPSQESFDGIWNESFFWNASPYFQGVTENLVWKTTTLTLQNGSFKVSILPPHYEILPQNSFHGRSPDTLYYGTFLLSPDTITFFVSGQDVPNRFLLHEQGDSLSLSALPLTNSDSLHQYFLWAHSFQKKSGLLKRAN